MDNTFQMLYQHCPFSLQTILISNLLQVESHYLWLKSIHTCILVYLVTVMHSMQAGYMDKAQKYTDKAIAQIEKLRTANFDNHPILSSFHVLLLEHTVQVWSLT